MSAFPGLPYIETFLFTIPLVVYEFEYNPYVAAAGFILRIIQTSMFAGPS